MQHATGGRRKAERQRSDGLSTGGVGWGGGGRVVVVSQGHVGGGRGGARSSTPAIQGRAGQGLIWGQGHVGEGTGVRRTRQWRAWLLLLPSGSRRVRVWGVGSAMPQEQSGWGPRPLGSLPSAEQTGAHQFESRGTPSWPLAGLFRPGWWVEQRNREIGAPAAFLARRGVARRAAARAQRDANDAPGASGLGVDVGVLLDLRARLPPGLLCRQEGREPLAQRG